MPFSVFGTQEEPVVVDNTSWQKEYEKPDGGGNNNTLLGVALAALLGLAIFFFVSKLSGNDFPKAKKESQPSHIQPDHSPDLDPKNAPQTKNKKHLKKWQTEINSNSYTAKLRSFYSLSEIGEDYNEDDNWEEDLRQIVWHIRKLRENNLLSSQSTDLDEVNEMLIEAIIKICHDHSGQVNIYDELEEALGPEFALYIVFVNHPKKGGFASFVIIPKQYDAWNFMRGYVAEWDADLEFVGFMKLKQKQQIVVEGYEFIEVVPYLYIRKMVNAVLEYFDGNVVYGNGVVPIPPPTQNKEPNILEHKN